MNAAAQNPPNAPVFEIPNPPDEFGQDGGKFYRCYDTLAQEIDDDMTSGLKEQLDGMLIFAGLFAGVNTAFLALTIPLLSADPADDTNALLARNNAILMQLVSGRNDTVPADSTLPSTAFSPSHDIFTINALFALSLTFAIISSFLAVLGRQWLVYYRKRGGGGPDRQRWEQLKRFLGAERWRLEAILDDVLPSLLQIGLIIFCASLILYLRHLSPAISLIVGIPLYVGLSFFIGSALCTVWDRFCPFHSPLSHLLLWTSHSLSWVEIIVRIRFFRPRDLFRRGIRSFRPRDLFRRGIRFFNLGVRFLQGIRLKREEESLESLQVIALQRAICISDDPSTLLYGTANIVTIRSPVKMNQLWDEAPFRQRFLDLLHNSKNGISQLRGYNVDSKDIAVSARCLYISAAAHIALTLDSRFDSCMELVRYMWSLDTTTIFIPVPLLQNSSSNLIKANMGAFTIWCLIRSASDSETDALRSHLTACSEVLARYSDLRFLSFFSWVVSHFPDDTIDMDSPEQMRQPYRGNAVDAMESVRGAFMTLLSSESAGSGVSLPRDTWLTNMLHCLEQIVDDEQGSSDMSIGHKFKLLEICEAFLRNSRIPEAAGQVGRKLRMNTAQIWSREYTSLIRNGSSADHLVDPLKSYIANLRNLDRSEFGYHEDIAVVQVSGPMLRQILSHRNAWWHREELTPICEMFNTFVSDVHKASRQFQKNSRRVRDPDERWCHWQEEPLSIKIERVVMWHGDVSFSLLLLSSPAAPQDDSVS